MLGFMDTCHRIGYGGGFYDRTIAQLKEVHKGNMLTVGVAFEAQKFDSYTGYLAEDDNLWFEIKEKVKSVKMREKFKNNSKLQWVQLPTDLALDHLITESTIYSKYSEWRDRSQDNFRQKHEQM